MNAPAPSLVERITAWTGSVASLALHTLLFVACFAAGALGLAEWNTILLVLTTAVSLEAIYLAIFIQMTMNRQAESLKNVEEDVDEIQKDVDEATLEGITEQLQALLKDVQRLKSVK